MIILIYLSDSVLMQLLATLFVIFYLNSVDLKLDPILTYN